MIRRVREGLEEKSIPYARTSERGRESRREWPGEERLSQLEPGLVVCDNSLERGRAGDRRSQRRNGKQWGLGLAECGSMDCICRALIGWGGALDCEL